MRYRESIRSSIGDDDTSSTRTKWPRDANKHSISRNRRVVTACAANLILTVTVPAISIDSVVRNRAGMADFVENPRSVVVGSVVVNRNVVAMDIEPNAWAEVVVHDIVGELRVCYNGFHAS